MENPTSHLNVAQLPENTRTHTHTHTHVRVMAMAMVVVMVMVYARTRVVAIGELDSGVGNTRDLGTLVCSIGREGFI